MAKIFKRNNKGSQNRGFRNKNSQQSGKDRPRKVSDKDLVDPIAYVGDLDSEKYPVLPLENSSQEKKEVEEPENPLNRRRTL